MIDILEVTIVLLLVVIIWVLRLLAAEHTMLMSIISHHLVEIKKRITKEK